MRLFRLINYCFLILLLSAKTGWSQDKGKIDKCFETIKKGVQDTNLIIAYNELATEFLGSADEKAKTYGYNALELSKKLKHPYLTSWSYNIIGLSYDYLGKPDIQQLADRSQEYYIYFLEPGNHCEDVKKKSNAQMMAIRFSAMGMATEVNFQRGMPEE